MSTLAVTEGDVQAAVNTYGKSAVTGNVFIWFLCAIAFLKVSQKIDTILASLGISTGHSGGSMMAEVLIATRTIFSAQQLANGGRSHSGNHSGNSERFLKGGLAGAVGRSFTSGGIKKATGNGNGGLGGKAYTSSLGKNGSFANNVIGQVATGNITSMGTISGAGSEAALLSYLGYPSSGSGAADIPSFTNVEIGGGRITATEVSSAHPKGIAIGMYHAEKYMKPDGPHEVVTAVDGSCWYKQYEFYYVATIGTSSSNTD